MEFTLHVKCLFVTFKSSCLAFVCQQLATLIKCYTTHHVLLTWHIKLSTCSSNSPLPLHTGFITAPRPTPPISPPVPAPSEYFSVLSQSTNKSLAIAVSADFFSCQDEDEPELELPLGRQPSFIFFDVPRKSVFTSIIHSPVAAAKLSMRKFLQMLSSVSPTKLTAALQKKQHHIQHLATRSVNIIYILFVCVSHLHSTIFIFCPSLSLLFRDGQVLESHAGLVESLLHTITSVWVTLWKLKLCVLLILHQFCVQLQMCTSSVIYLQLFISQSLPQQKLWDIILFHYFCLYKNSSVIIMISCKQR